jgi:hypothetical protein
MSGLPWTIGTVETKTRLDVVLSEHRLRDEASSI